MPTSLSTNGALTYALKHNRISLFDLVALGKHQASKLNWVGPMVWDEANFLVSRLKNLVL